VCQWLEHTDPSPNRHAADDLYESGTGDWVFRTPQWDSWINYRCRCLWLHGIPGAGKTILAAHVTTALEQQHKATSHQGKLAVATIYYFCYHGRNGDETHSFLRWLVTQLCRLSGQVPEHVLRVYRMGRQPSRSDLLSSLYEALGSFRAVFVTIDAVDESKTRENLLAAIRKLATDPAFAKIQLFVTSREYEDIKRVMEPIAEPISMSNPYVEADIKTFITAKIKSTPGFSSWPDKLREEIRVKLSEGAKGMFRWAVCQLDILRRCRDVIRIRKALKDLPQTIEESYDRIFSYISQDDWAILAHTFRMIYSHSQVFSSEPLSSNLLLSSFSAFGEPNAAMNDSHSQHFYDSDALKEICGCLINFGSIKREYEGVQLAHFTIREFLVSDRILGTHSAYFHIDPDSVNAFYLKKVVEHAAMVQSWEPTKLRVLDIGALSLRHYCLISSLKSIDVWQNLAAEDGCVLSTAAQLVDPFDPLFSSRVLACYDIEPHTPETLSHVRRGYYPLFYGTLWGRMEIPDDLAAARVIFLLMSRFRTLARKYAETIEISRISRLKLRIFIQPQKMLSEVLLEGSATNLIAQAGRFSRYSWLGLDTLLSILGSDHLGDITSLLVSFVGWHNHWICILFDTCFLVKLLGFGADPNAAEYRVTPLQIAAFQGDARSVEILLNAGAIPSLTGNPRGKPWDQGTYLGTYFNTLHGRSPLHLAQHPEISGEYGRLGIEEQVDHEAVERVLLSWSGRDGSMGNT